MAIRRVNLVLICPSGDCNRSLAATYYSARDWIASPRMHKDPQSYEPERVSGLPFTAKRLIPPFTAYGYSTDYSVLEPSSVPDRPPQGPDAVRTAGPERARLEFLGVPQAGAVSVSRESPERLPIP